MADHFSGPRAIADPASDITDLYAFPSPERPGHVVLILDVFPAADRAALFSDAISYRFRIRPVTAVPAGVTPAFAVGEDERAFRFTFTAPAESNGTVALAQYGTCATPGGQQIPLRVGEVTASREPGLRIFAGTRMDPFFIDIAGVQATEATQPLAFKPEAGNAPRGQNVLSIVVEASAAVLGPGRGRLLAVAGETVTSGGHPVRLERTGRPEIKKIIMSAKKLDPVNRDLEIRDLYNADDAFSLGQYYLGAYRSRLNANLAFFDHLDGKIDWPPDHRGNHPLTELFLADFLVVDTSRPFSEHSYLEIETALLAGHPHTTCGGRAPNDDIVDTLYTLLVGGIDGARISDGVHQATQPATRRFPYLASADPNPPDLRTVLPAQSASPEETASPSGAPSMREGMWS